MDPSKTYSGMFMTTAPQMRPVSNNAKNRNGYLAKPHSIFQAPCDSSGCSLRVLQNCARKLSQVSKKEGIFENQTKTLKSPYLRVF